VGTTMIQKTKSRRRSGDAGFTLIETMIAIVVMTIGILALMASFATAIAATASAQEDLIARHKALDAMESIYTARNSQQIPFASVNNTTANPPGIFLPGPQPLLCAGNDGLVGTGDDVPCSAPDTGAACPGGVECLVLPGADGILGTADDITQSLGNFQPGALSLGAGKHQPGRGDHCGFLYQGRVAGAHLYGKWIDLELSLIG
jgi:type II secretory pathway pseudopilin PulG